MDQKTNTTLSQFLFESQLRFNAWVIIFYFSNIDVSWKIRTLTNKTKYKRICTNRKRKAICFRIYFYLYFVILISITKMCFFFYFLCSEFHILFYVYNVISTFIFIPIMKALTCTPISQDYRNLKLSYNDYGCVCLWIFFW